jgi:hypothetical protein
MIFDNSVGEVIVMEARRASACRRPREGVSAGRGEAGLGRVDRRWERALEWREDGVLCRPRARSGRVPARGPGPAEAGGGVAKLVRACGG